MSFTTPVVLDNLSFNLIKADNSEAAAITGALAYYSLAKIVKQQGMALANAKWNVYTTILGIIVGTVVWHEELTEKKIAGLGLAVIGLYLMNH